MSPREKIAAELVECLLAGEKRALARAISLVENDDPEGWALVREVYPRAGNAAVVGFTGPPGVGKSTIIGALTAGARIAGREVAVLSIDPSSPFSKGALLGDRTRLTDHFLDSGLFIRSMASRGSLGGREFSMLRTLGASRRGRRRGGGDRPARIRARAGGGDWLRACDQRALRCARDRLPERGHGDPRAHDRARVRDRHRADRARVADPGAAHHARAAGDGPARGRGAKSHRLRNALATGLAATGLALMLLGVFGALTPGEVWVGVGAVATFLGLALLSPQPVAPMASLIGRPLERLRGVLPDRRRQGPGGVQGLHLRGDQPAAGGGLRAVAWR